MKKLFLIFIGTLAMALCSGVAQGQDNKGQVNKGHDNKGPRMVVEGRQFDFNEVKEGTVLEHTFKIFNKGDEPLKIISVRPG